jgi:serine/threonine protein kinase
MTMADPQESFLDSLRLYDGLRLNATNVTRDKGSNIDRFSLPNGEEIALCHLSGILPFTWGDFVPQGAAFEDVASVALAIHHLNVGDGSIVPQVSGLNNRCKVRFTTEFADTEYQGGVALKHVVAQTSRLPGTSERIPCAFMGAYRSSVSIPTSIVTGVLGYPQVSSGSTSADLDDVSQYPLFARTLPSDAGTTVPIILYIRNVLQVSHLAVINVNDAYGNAFVEGMRKAAALHAPDMVIHQIPLDEDQGSIEGAVASLKNTEFRFVFCLVFTTETHDAVLMEAYNNGVAGNGLHNWLFGDSFTGTLDGRIFEKGSPLHLSYRGSALMEVSGGVPGMPNYDNYASKMEALRNPTDLEYLGSLFPKHEHPDYGSEPPFIGNDDFLTRITNGFSPFIYEAAIALGLAACDAYQDNESFSGQEHFDRLVETTFTGVSGNVVFDQVTGTRDPNSALYKVANFVEEDTGDGVRFVPVVTDLFQDGDWNQQEEFLFNDGTTNLPRDLPPPIEDNGDDGTSLALLIGGPVAVVVALIVSVMIFLFYENKRKDNDSVWKVEKEELKFSEPPEVIGRGTFGVVLLAEYRGTQVAVKRVIPLRSEKTKRGSSNADNSDSCNLETKTVSSAGTYSNTGMKSGTLGVSSRCIVGKSSSWIGESTSNEGRSSTVFGTRPNDAAMLRKMKQEFVEEMRYLSKLRHPCVTTIMGAVTGKDPMLVMEYMEHGSLYDLLHNETLCIEGELLLPILRDVSQGVRFLHSANPQVIHGDLKAQNILVDSKFRAKVADFGLSQKKNLGGTGTPFWMAPELLRAESANTAATDVYSFGIILYEVYSRRDPYEDENPEEVLRLVADKSVRKRPPAPNSMPAKLKSLMSDCVEDEADKRPTFEELDARLKRIDAETADPGQASNKASSISLFDIFPRHIAEALRDGRTVDAEHRDSVTIFFSDIVGFTTISAELEPRKVASMLDRLYTKFDALSQKHDIFKVETIGDA